ncbi:MAG: CAP domain-containing protein [Verrucomicrobiales bacterium]
MGGCRVHAQVIAIGISVWLGTACQQRDEREGAKVARSSQSPAQVEAEVFRRVNEYRRSRGLAALARDQEMDRSAQAHSERMARRGKLDHRGSGRRFRDLQREPTSLISFAENVAFNLRHERPGEVAVQGWLRSPGHHRNILRPDDRLTGIGVAQAADGSWYLTQLHGRRDRR